GRPRLWAAGLSLSLLLAVVVTWLVVGRGPYVAPTPDVSRGEVSPSEAAATLHRFEQAVDAGDEAAARELAPAGDEKAAELLGALVSNARALHVRDFTLRYVDELGALSGGSWDAAVDVTWGFAGFDRVPAHAEVLVRFAAEDGGVALEAIGGGDRRSPVWLSGPVEVRRTPTTLVLVEGPSAEADALARRATRAVPVVRRVLRGWRPHLVVEVPRSAAALDQALDATPGEYANIAAVTTTADGSVTPGSPVHVFVNPDVFSRLKPRGAQVVMSHEATHVATDAATSTMPLWLLEGFADYVALRDVDLPLSTTAGQVIKQVRRHGPPAALPGRAEFDTATTHLGAAYEAAWLACRLLAEAGGERGLVRLYDDVDAGRSVDEALRSHVGLGEREFIRMWQRRLSDLAA
ncbi:MAG TPA: hypothetical protein VFT00_10160, partial [Nocardioides sp.]|nr:hypothetical protein [Nocardioides sp.]